MLKKPCVRTLMHSQYVKGSQTVLKSGRQVFWHFFLSLWKKINSKISVLVVSIMLRLLVNILTPEDKYSLPVKKRVFNETNSNAII